MMNVYNQLMAQGGKAIHPFGDTIEDHIAGQQVRRPMSIRIKAQCPPDDVTILSSDIGLPYDYCWFEMADSVPGGPGHLNRCIALAVQIFPCVDECTFKDTGVKVTHHSAIYVLYKNIDFSKLKKHAPIETAYSKSAKSLVAYLDLTGRLSWEQGHFARWNCRMPDGAENNPAVQDQYRDAMNLVTSSVLWSCNLLACKNVKLKQAPLKRVKPKKGKKQLFSYHVLDVPQPQTRYNETNPPSGRTHRLHLCRGHFRTYTEAAPLFGKVTGRIWVPAHVKGRDRSGIVHKDYAI